MSKEERMNNTYGGKYFLVKKETLYLRGMKNNIPVSKIVGLDYADINVVMADHLKYMLEVSANLTVAQNDYDSAILEAQELEVLAKRERSMIDVKIRSEQINIGVKVTDKSVESFSKVAKSVTDLEDSCIKKNKEALDLKKDVENLKQLMKILEHKKSAWVSQAANDRATLSLETSNFERKVKGEN